MVYNEDSYHSSVLRVASGDTELWTHYDVMHNMLIQVTGTKHVTLWPPSEDDNLYTQGSSSRVPDVYEPDLARFPRFSRTYHTRVTGLLRPGEAVFIPPLWFHHVQMPDFSVAVNVFWRGHAAALYNPKDIYGNKDLPAADAAMATATKAGEQLKSLPEPFRTFYARRAAAQLLSAAAACGGEEMTVTFSHVPSSASASKVMLHGKVCVITGANRGIGRQIALALACRGATVIMVCRDACKGRIEAAAIRALSRNHHVWVEEADVSDAASVEALGQRLALEFGAVHVLVNNAVTAPAVRTTVATERGAVEAQWAVNVVGYHLLLFHLQDLLKKAAALNQHPRVLNLASQFAGNLMMDDLEFNIRTYSSVTAYMQSKQADRMLTWTWARRLAPYRVQVNAIHPGAVLGTQLAQALALKRGTHTAEEAADCVVAAAAADDECHHASGCFFVNGVSTRCEFQEDQEACDRLVALLESKYS